MMGLALLNISIVLQGYADSQCFLERFHRSLVLAAKRSCAEGIYGLGCWRRGACKLQLLPLFRHVR